MRQRWGAVLCRMPDYCIETRKLVLLTSCPPNLVASLVDDRGRPGDLPEGHAAFSIFLCFVMVLFLFILSITHYQYKHVYIYIYICISKSLSLCKNIYIYIHTQLYIYISKLILVFRFTEVLAACSLERLEVRKVEALAGLRHAELDDELAVFVLLIQARPRPLQPSGPTGGAACRKQGAGESSRRDRPGSTPGGAARDLRPGPRRRSGRSLRRARPRAEGHLVLCALLVQ